VVDDGVERVEVVSGGVRRLQTFLQLHIEDLVPEPQSSPKFSGIRRELYGIKRGQRGGFRITSRGTIADTRHCAIHASMVRSFW